MAVFSNAHWFLKIPTFLDIRLQILIPKMQGVTTNYFYQLCSGLYLSQSAFPSSCIYWHIFSFTADSRTFRSKNLVLPIFTISAYVWSSVSFVRSLCICLNPLKLDGVGPVDNRPSTDQLHHFVQFVLMIKKNPKIYIYFFYNIFNLIFF